MDVELEQVKEGVGHEVDGAVDVALDAEVQFQGSPGFVAGWEGYVLEVAGGVCNLGITPLACCFILECRTYLGTQSRDCMAV